MESLRRGAGDLVQLRDTRSVSGENELRSRRGKDVSDETRTEGRPITFEETFAFALAEGYDDRPSETAS